MTAQNHRTPLAGMRVLDLSQQLPGPYATLLLAALGASVTKVEPPSGDASRQLDPEMFDNVNAGKHSVVLDLKSSGGRARLHERVREIDVFVEGFRPGISARLGCDYPTLRMIRPELVYCSISGAGQTGPLATHPTHDISLQAIAGTLKASEPVDRVGVPWVDLATGSSVALAVTAAWQAGRGIYLDMSMLDSALAWSRVKPSALNGGRQPTYGTACTSDDQWVVIALLEDPMWVRLCRAFRWTDWADDPRLATHQGRQRHGDQVRDRLDREIRGRTLAEMLTLARHHDLPIGPADARNDPGARQQLAARIPRDTPSWRSCVPLPDELISMLSPAPNQDPTVAPPNRADD